MSTFVSLNRGFQFGRYYEPGMYTDFPIHSTPTSHIRIRKHRPNDDPYGVYISTNNARISQTVQDVADKTLDPVEAISVGYSLAGIQPAFNFTYPDGRVRQYSY